jgi:RNA polymerase sigma-70 factor (ECF subfamily)
MMFRESTVLRKSLSFTRVLPLAGFDALAFRMHDSSRMKQTDKPGGPSSEDWDALVCAVGTSRDLKAFEALFGYFAPRIKSYLMRSGATDAIAEDLAQEAILLVWRKAALFDPAKACASTWIFTIARNLRASAFRRERRPDCDPYDPSDTPDTSADGTSDLIRQVDAGRLHAVLKDLSPEQFEIVRMSFFAEKPHSAIAAELGLPLGTVKSRIRLAMVRIRSALGDSA